MLKLSLLFFILISINVSAQNVDIINYNNNRDTKLLFDYYHHNLPSTKVGKHITTGSWVSSDGRYGWNDFVHTNTLDHLYTILSKEYSISMSRSPFSKELLKGFDGVVIFAADNPKLIPNAHVISDKEISALRNYVYQGGSLMLMLNAIDKKKRFNESFETKQVGKLVNSFGLGWNNTDTHYSDIVMPAGQPYFYDVDVFHYGAGCTLKVLPTANEPKVLLNVYSDSTYTDRSVSGAGIVMVCYGKGKFILIGDVGSWTGNISRPWTDNGKIVRQLFRYMKRDRGVHPAVFQSGKLLHYKVKVAGLQAIPRDNSLSKIAHPKYRMFSPRPTTDMPYFEASAKLELTPKDTLSDAFQFNTKVSNFEFFDQKINNKESQTISMLVNRQGKVSNIETNGWYAQWLASDISVLSALLPTNGIEQGDAWQSVESIRIPSLRATTELPTAKMRNIDIYYMKDTMYKGKRCRLLQSSGEAWLSDWDIEVEDILPLEEDKRVGGSNYRFLNERGGKILFKREQWVDFQTGIVLGARIQTRIIAWVQDERRSVGVSNYDKDYESLVSLAHTATFELE